MVCSGAYPALRPHACSDAHSELCLQGLTQPCNHQGCFVLSSRFTCFNCFNPHQPVQHVPLPRCANKIMPAQHRSLQPAICARQPGLNLYLTQPQVTHTHMRYNCYAYLRELGFERRKGWQVGLPAFRLQNNVHASVRNSVQRTSNLAIRNAVCRGQRRSAHVNTSKD